MANELRHSDVGTALSKSEWEGTTNHVFNSQAAGDIMYASSTSQLSRLAIGSANQLLAVNSGGTAPEWITSVGAATLASTVTVVDSTDTSSYIAMFDSATGSLAAKTDAGITYNSGTGMLTATGFTGPLTGTASVATTVTVTDNESTAENNLIPFVAGAATGTGNHGLEMDGNVYYNPSTGVITATGFAGALTGNVTGTASTATVATTVTITDNESTDEDNAIIFTAGGDVDGGDIGLESDGTLTYNPSTGSVTATGFIGNVTGNASGSALTVTQAAQTAITSVGTLTGLTTSGDIELGHASDTTVARSASGTVTIEGSVITTAGVMDMWIPAGAMRAASTNGCADITDVETTATRPDMQVLDFDSSTQEYAQFSIAMPKSWNEGTVTAQFYWTHATAVATDVIWGIQGVCVSDNDTIDIAYGTAQTVTDTFHNAAEDLAISAATSAITLAGTPAEGDLAFFQVYRDADAAGDDTNSTDARLVGVKLMFTTNAANDA